MASSRPVTTTACGQRGRKDMAATPVRPDPEPLTVPQPMSRRMRAKLAGDALKPIDQVRVPSQWVTYGAWCYYARPDGRTLRDTLILQPNGGDAPDVADPRLRGRYATNSEHYRERGRQKGFIPLGSRLTPEGVRIVVDILKRNHDEAVLEAKDEIAQCNYTIQTTGSERDRAVAVKRKAQWEKLLATVLQPIDGDALVAELDEISRAQRMASFGPQQVAMFREMLGAELAKLGITTSFTDMVSKFARPPGTGDADLQGQVGAKTLDFGDDE